MKQKLLTLLVGLFFGGMILEIGLRLVYPPPPEWHQPQTWFYQSDLLGHVHVPETDSFSIDAPVSINSLGLRDEAMSWEKPRGEIRILALGDSFTFGLGVPRVEAWPEQLEQNLDAAITNRRVQVINGGVSGYNTRQELIYLLTDGLRLQPDLIVVGFYWNDLVHNDRSLPDLSLPRFVVGSDEMGDEHVHVLPDFVRNALRRSRLLYVANLRRQALQAWLNPTDLLYVNVQRALLHGDDTFLEPHWQSTSRRLLDMAAAATNSGIPIVLARFPMENEIRFEFPDMMEKQRLAEIWRPTGMPFVDVTEEYRARMDSGENPFLFYDMHPNASGMKIMSDALATVILEQDLLPR